jgi:hypothetical protein
MARLMVQVKWMDRINYSIQDRSSRRGLYSRWAAARLLAVD